MDFEVKFKEDVHRLPECEEELAGCGCCRCKEADGPTESTKTLVDKLQDMGCELNLFLLFQENVYAVADVAEVHRTDERPAVSLSDDLEEEENNIKEIVKCSEVYLRIHYFTTCMHCTSPCLFMLSTQKASMTLSLNLNVILNLHFIDEDPSVPARFWNALILCLRPHPFQVLSVEAWRLLD